MLHRPRCHGHHHRQTAPGSLSHSRNDAHISVASSMSRSVSAPPAPLSPSAPRHPSLFIHRACGPAPRRLTLSRRHATFGIHRIASAPSSRQQVPELPSPSLPAATALRNGSIFSIFSGTSSTLAALRNRAAALAPTRFTLSRLCPRPHLCSLRRACASHRRRRCSTSILAAIAHWQLPQVCAPAAIAALLISRARHSTTRRLAAR